MNLDPLQQHLLEAARRNPPSDAVPWAFEQRIMAHIRARRPTDRLTLWTAGLMRAALSSLAVAVLLVGANALVPGVGADEQALSLASLDVVVATPAESLVDLW